MKKYIILSFLFIVICFANAQSGYNYIDQEMIDTTGAGYSQRFKRVFNIQTSSFFNLKSDLTGFYSVQGTVEPYNFCGTTDTLPDTHLFSEDKTATQDIEHELDTFDFLMNHSYGSFDIGNNGLYRGIGVDKYISPTERIVMKMMDLSPYGGDSTIIHLGKMQFSTGDDTSIKIEPNKGVISVVSDSIVKIISDDYILLDTDNDVSVTAQNDVSVTAQNDVSVTAQNDVSVTAQKDILVTADSIILVNADSIISVNAQKDILVTAQNDVFVTAQNDVFVDVENFSVDADSIISISANDFSVDVANDFSVDVANDFSVTADSVAISTQRIIFFDYPNTRNNTDTTTPENYLYTDANGNLLSHNYRAVDGTYTLVASTSTITLSHPVHDEWDIQVFRSEGIETPITDYTVDGTTTLTFTTSAGGSDEEILIFGR